MRVLARATMCVAGGGARGCVREGEIRLAVRRKCLEAILSTAARGGAECEAEKSGERRPRRT